MNATDAELDRLADEVHAACLQPLAVAERQAVAARIPVRPDAGAASYFVAPTRPRMAAADFELPVGQGPSDLLDALQAHWSRQQPALVSLAARLRPLAALMQELDPQESGEISAFVYVMY